MSKTSSKTSSKTLQITCECDTEVPCCTALNTEPIDPIEAANEAEVFSALGDPYRVAIVHLIAATGEPVCVVDVERHLPISQSTVSYHLKTLLEAGLVNREKRGRWSYYSLNLRRFEYLALVAGEYRQRAIAMN